MASRMNNRNAQTQYAQIDFVVRRLNSDEAKQFTGWRSAEDDELALEVAQFMASGHKTSITWDNNNACFIVSSTCKDDKSPNYNKCISSRSDDWYEALLMNVFKHVILFKSKAWVGDQQTNNWG